MNDLLKLAQSVMKEERWSEAIKLLKEKSSLVEKHWELLWNLGWCYFKLGRMDEARKYLTKATRLSPENPVCKWALGNVYLKQKQYKKAKALLIESLPTKETHSAPTSLSLPLPSQETIQDSEKTY